jgi:glyoxylate reductase
VARCFVTRRLPGSALDRLGSAHEVEIWPGREPPTHAQLIEHVGAAEGLLSMLTDRVDAEVIESAPKLRAISNYAVGYDNIDLAAGAARGIPVGNTPDVLTDATADLAFALLMAAARKLVEAAADVRDGDWKTWEPNRYLGADVYGATLGIIGFGRIGRAVAERAQGFAMRVIHTGASSTAEERDQLLSESDFVSIHSPLTPETHHLIDGDALRRMKPTAILVNTARGGCVDESALIAALHAGRIFAAALDVFEHEPKIDPRFYDCPRLVLAPHIGSATTEARTQMAQLCADAVIDVLAGRRPANLVNREVVIRG